jgi:tRNA A-37 threonylcarbamoyl transferase component Bud32
MNPVASWEGSTILADPQDEMVGKTLNDTYAVERVLGEGGMGRVYLARHTRIAQKRVAVKVLHLEYMRNPEMLARFQREAEAAASITHPNVVAVYDVDRTAQSLPYLVCEYLEGLDLWQHLKQQNKLCLSTAVHVVRQLCGGLQAAHRCGVIHRDLKPQNIFLVGDFAKGVPEFVFIKILDFGLSKFMDVAAGQLVTKTGVIMGTPAFMSPEQAMGQHADVRADVYGVGALLYTCLTGQLPFEESTPQATLLAVVGSDPRRPRVLDPSIPEYAELVIERAMAKQPSKRYADMAALLDALEPLVETRSALHEVESARPVRPASFDMHAEHASAARPKLVLFLTLALALLLGSLALAFAGIERVSGWSLNRLELGLLLACTAAVAITPTVLVVRRVRTLVWGNTNRVLELLSGVRVAVLTAIATYGLVWFGFRFFDGVVLRLMGEPIRANITWPGWDFLLPVIGLGAGTVALLRQRALSEMFRGRRRAIVGILTLIATLGPAAIVIPLGLVWQARQSGKVPAAAVAASSVGPALSHAGTTPPTKSALASDATSGTLENTAGANEISSAPLSSAAASSSSLLVKQASEQELSAAAARGVEGWLSLAAQYPADSRVLRALVLAHASRAAELGKAMLVARRLFKVAPEEGKATDMQYLVQRAAETPGLPAELAWKMLAEEMGTYGPDVLYRVMLTRPKLAERAERSLRDAAVRGRGTQALAIAYELRAAPSCAARLPLLERATQVGDDRALDVLAALSTGAARGCGQNKRKPCPPACPDQVEAFRAAMTKLSLRVKGSNQ